MDLTTIIALLVNNSCEENKQLYEDYVSRLEYNLIKENNLKKAFTIRAECATQLIRKWIPVYGNLTDCPVSYADTLNRPFMLEKNKYLKTGF